MVVFERTKKEKSKARDNVDAGLVINKAILDGFPAPCLRYRLDCAGPKERERDAYNEARFAYHDAMLAGNEFAAAEHYKKLMAFVIEEKWSEEVVNLVTTVGKTDIIDKYLKGSSYTGAFYMILKGAGSVSASDTLASHAGWSESTPYSGNRPAITWGTTSGGSNTATAVSFTINATATVAGAGVCTVNTGTSGTLYSISDFGASRSVASGDTLNVTPTLSVT